MATLCIDSDFDLGTSRRPEHALGAGWGLEQQRCLDILGDELSNGQSLLEDRHEPLFAGVSVGSGGVRCSRKVA